MERSNVVQLPELSELDKQFLILEKQQEQIREQSKLIAEKTVMGETMTYFGWGVLSYMLLQSVAMKVYQTRHQMHLVLKQFIMELWKLDETSRFSNSCSSFSLVLFVDDSFCDTFRCIQYIISTMC